MRIRTAAALAAASAAAFTGVTAGASVGHATGSAGTGAAAQVEEGMTRLVYEVDDCEGCVVRLTNARRPEGEGRPTVWRSKAKAVEGGEVRFTVGTRRTWGMSVSLEAPWEGHTGYLTTVVQRYDDRAVGERVSFREARRSGVASSCWAGTRSAEVRTEVVVRRVRVDGVRAEVPGTLAFTRVTQDWHEPMRRAYGGVLGTQDADVCR